MSNEKSKKDFVSSLINKGKKVSLVLNNDTSFYDIESIDVSSGDVVSFSVEKNELNKIIKELLNATSI